MKIVVAGGTGFIGRELVRSLVERRDEVVVLTRDVNAGRRIVHPSADLVRWDGESVSDWWSHVSGVDAIINLCGESLSDGRWTAKRKERLVASRVGPTRSLVEGIRRSSTKPQVLLNISGVGYYGAVEQGDVTEAHPRGSGFLAELCEQWEQAARSVEPLGVRVVVLRCGVVLGDGGGALERMIPPFKFFVGGPLGSGNQWFPWVHRDDLIGALLFALRNTAVSGPVNVAAPESVNMRQFSAAIGIVLGRPSWAPVPAFALRLVFGEMAEMLLTGQRVVPDVLMKAEFTFRYPSLIAALTHILQN